MERTVKKEQTRLSGDARCGHTDEWGGLELCNSISPKTDRPTQGDGNILLVERRLGQSAGRLTGEMWKGSNCHLLLRWAMVLKGGECQQRMGVASKGER